jgi:hypothetical protein
MSIEVVRQVRSGYPTPLGATHAAFLLELAPALTAAHWRPWGLLKKPGGTNILLPDGTRVSQDVVCDMAGIQVDCLADGEGAAVPVWNPVDPGHYTPDPSRFYAVEGAPVPPEPEPEPEPPPSTGLEARVAALEAQVAELDTAVDEAKRLALAALDAASQAAKTGDPVSVSGSVSLREAIAGTKVTWTGQVL